jgi:LysM repeat protein
MPLVADLAALATPPHAYTAPANANGWKPVIVRPGDTVWQLAATHRSTVEALVARNGLTRGGHVLYPGQRILVPGAATHTSRSSARVQGSHVVRSGDTMEAIAQRHSVTLRLLIRANPGVSPRMIFPGQRLTIPGGAPRTTRSAARAAAAPARTHSVRPGETMTGIAAAYGIPLERLIAANRGTNADVLFVGQRVIVPGTAKATSAGVSKRPTATSANTFAGYTYPPATVRAADANRARLARMAVPTRTQTAALVRRVAVRHGVDPRLALAVAYLESGWNQRAVSVANAVGTMQVIPASGSWASQLAGRRLDLLDTRDNITAGVLILRALQSTATSREEAIAGYYQGLRSVRTQGMYPDTKRYVSTVLALYKRM